MDGRLGLCGYASSMLNYAMQCALDALKNTHRVVLATDGPAGVLASEFQCEAVKLVLYLLLPTTSDHLFNLEHNPLVSLVTEVWEIKGQAGILVDMPADLHLDILSEPNHGWYTLVRINPHQIHFLREKGWGDQDTLDISEDRGV